MRDKNPQNAKVGDLIMWADYDGGGINFGKIVSFAFDWRPMAKGFRQPWSGYANTQRVTDGWMVIAYGDGRAETTTEEHPIAKARRQFMELEGRKGYAF